MMSFSAVVIIVTATPVPRPSYPPAKILRFAAAMDTTVTLPARIAATRRLRRACRAGVAVFAVTWRNDGAAAAVCLDRQEQQVRGRRHSVAADA
jgi:hypothetical protein